MERYDVANWIVLALGVWAGAATFAAFLFGKWLKQCNQSGAELLALLEEVREDNYKLAAAIEKAKRNGTTRHE